MFRVNDVTELSGTLSFRLGVLGTRVSERYAAQLVPLGLKPKHAGVLMLVRANSGISQQELAESMRVAPSLVVSLADHLEQLGALERVRDPADRRRQQLALTARGRQLLAKCTRIAEKLDDELTTELAAIDRDRLNRLLGTLTASEGI